MAEDRERRPIRTLLRVLKVLIVLFVLSAVGVVVYSWWTTFGPMPQNLDSVRSITELPVPGGSELIGLRTERFPWPRLHARLRMSAEDFERWREDLPFDLTRDPDTVSAARDWLQWPGGEDARTPEWWRPDELSDPLAAFAWYPTAEAPPDDPFPAHHLRMLAEQRPDGTVDVYLVDIVD